MRRKRHGDVQLLQRHRARSDDNHTRYADRAGLHLLRQHRRKALYRLRRIGAKIKMSRGKQIISTEFQKAITAVLVFFYAHLEVVN